MYPSCLDPASTYELRAPLFFLWCKTRGGGEVLIIIAGTARGLVFQSLRSEGLGVFSPGRQDAKNSREHCNHRVGQSGNSEPCTAVIQDLQNPNPEPLNPGP